MPVRPTNSGKSIKADILAISALIGSSWTSSVAEPSLQAGYSLQSKGYRTAHRTRIAGSAGRWKTWFDSIRPFASTARSCGRRNRSDWCFIRESRRTVHTRHLTKATRHDTKSHDTRSKPRPTYVALDRVVRTVRPGNCVLQVDAQHPKIG